MHPQSWTYTTTWNFKWTVLPSPKGEILKRRHWYGRYCIVLLWDLPAFLGHGRTFLERNFFWATLLMSVNRFQPFWKWEGICILLYTQQVPLISSHATVDGQLQLFSGNPSLPLKLRWQKSTNPYPFTFLIFIRAGCRSARYFPKRQSLLCRTDILCLILSWFPASTAKHRTFIVRS